MASNIFSRLNSTTGRARRSFYESLRSGDDGGQNEAETEGHDVEERAELALDEENLNEQFQDYDLEHADGLGADASRATIESAAVGTIAGGAATSAAAAAAAYSEAGTGKWSAANRGRRGHGNTSHSRWGDDDADDDDVPDSLLVEPQGPGADPFPPMLKATPLRLHPSDRRSRGPGRPIPGPATKKIRAQWEATKKHQQPYGNDTNGVGGSSGGMYGELPGPHLLQIPEHDMQTVSWQDVVVKVMALRDQNPKTATNMTRLQREWIGSQSKERLDAHDIANRLMRRENYLIALFNKDILDLSVPLPFLRNKQFLTRTLEWTLWFGVLDFVFDERGQVNQEFLKSNRRSQLSTMLKSRFLFAGFMNLLLAPFVACYLVVVYFLTYYNEYQKNPSALGARAYTPLAEWKFREFNELEHLFEERLNMSYPFATRYLDQFPKRKTEQVAKTVAFIAGAVMTVLAIASLVDPELFLGFEITHDRTVLFYVGIFATVWATARGMITEDNSVFDPEYALRNVIEYTHYEPDHWKGRLHSFDVKVEFSELYQIKIKIFFEEILSIFFTPLILFTSLPRSSDQIIDFFREFTIHVDGLGYVCSFAVFDFNKGMGATSNPKRQEQQSLQPDPLGTGGGDVRDDYYSTKHGKMAASYYGFLDNYVINPKTGIPGHHPPGGGRHYHTQFYPPPAFPGLNSPTLAADMQNSRIRHRGSGTTGAGGALPSATHASLTRTPRFGPSSMAQPSPMASILLDPHHQPSTIPYANRSMHRPRIPGGGVGRYSAGGTGESYIVEEPAMEDSRVAPGSVIGGGGGAGHRDGAFRDNEPFQPPPQAQSSSGELQSGPGMLDESTWQTSPPTGLSRENSGVDDDADVGVLGLMYQFQQAHQNHRIR
ncbi:hypothetical protein HMPREF1624_01068 [Sporothrix schenckii ATCC 58251]|uniref:Autophagy-related protein 9 n=1 Tax=Sporothrix schenckii (strain ATCC 58251 / de Perez 2211183) TaxID=1391915 RepID=U7Q7Q1_SPOS1|nr:hypothetical protein HMPREF1624_01068 [Sporothrix schenckii ATCC 58251]